MLLSPDQLQATLDRVRGPTAQEPFISWYEAVKTAADNGEEVDLVSLALIYKATNAQSYLDLLIERLPTEGAPSREEIYAVDILFGDIPEAHLQGMMQRAGADRNAFYYESLGDSQAADFSWGYHDAFGATPALAYAGLFALTTLELEKDLEQAPFDALNYIANAAEELSPTGHFFAMENRIAGDPSYNSALPGDYGGMYDNVGYDRAEESYSINLLSQFYVLTGEARHLDFLHDRHRGRFCRYMEVPHRSTLVDSDRWCHTAGTTTRSLARIWYTRTDSEGPRYDVTALTAALYEDGEMQRDFLQQQDRIRCGSPYQGIYWDLIYYDPTIAPTPHDEGPTAAYFSGPGLVTMRQSWGDDAAFAVFVAGEGISRRYEDANSFIIHRKSTLFPHAGARIRFNEDNTKHHWYHIRSLAKNTMRIYDPDETLDEEGQAWHSGTPLVPSDNFGGQRFETTIASEDMSFATSSGGRENDPNHPLGIYEVADVRAYEHVEGHYTYTKGDASGAYSGKVDLIERDFVYLRPDLFVIFDRVNSVDPTFRKVWTMHSVDRPEATQAPSAQELGMRAFDNLPQLDWVNATDHARLHMLLPQDTLVTVRGGDSILLDKATLTAGSPISEGQLVQPDMARWLEIFAVGEDLEGNLVIHGDALEGSSVTETIAIDPARRRYELSSAPSEAVSATSLRDSTQSWQENQWLGYMVETSLGDAAVITGNSSDTLFANLTPGSAWRYRIYRPLANSNYHWEVIRQLTTDNLSLSALTISTPHDFDAVDVAGRLHSFSPRTDGEDDQYTKRADIGQWTIEVEANQLTELTHFLNVISLGDPGVSHPSVNAAESESVAAAIIADQVVLFAKGAEALTDFSISLAHTTALSGLAFGLLPSTNYWVSLDGDELSVSTLNNGGEQAQSSEMGVLSFTIL